MATTTWKLQLGTAIAALLLVSGLVLRVSAAAFTAQDSNPDNSWVAGALDLTESRNGVAAFNAVGLMPGEATDPQCITVTYAGDADPQPVKLLGQNVVDASGLGDDLNVVVEEGDGTAADCSDFANGVAIANVSLTTFAANATGYGSWDPTATGQSKTYRFVVTLSASTDSSLQGASAEVDFVWRTST